MGLTRTRTRCVSAPTGAGNLPFHIELSTVAQSRRYWITCCLQILEDMVGDTNKTFAGLSGMERQTKVVKHGDDHCKGCGREIIGRVIQAMDATWHPDCFVCSQCSKPVFQRGQDTYSVVNNQVGSWLVIR